MGTLSQWGLYRAGLAIALPNQSVDHIQSVHHSLSARLLVYGNRAIDETALGYKG